MNVARRRAGQSWLDAGIEGYESSLCGKPVTVKVIHLDTQRGVPANWRCRHTADLVAAAPTRNHDAGLSIWRVRRLNSKQQNLIAPGAMKWKPAFECGCHARPKHDLRLRLLLRQRPSSGDSQSSDGNQ